ncbi:unnamed protein product [Thlaspi arvense]|uniref:Uncharacterized protein n=1 Tax=Thlaspi arvense TaxID=13288 RepID=A0AAU9RQQ3_THLAR|nr:unnamed protein product [Thlaspi arvense]
MSLGDGCINSMSLGDAPNLGERCPRTGYTPPIYCPALVCSYRPSLVQVNLPSRKRKERHV